jgi:predicted ATPase
VILKTVTIKNFRALEDIEVTLGPNINVIVGPNAIGKTTFLEAIRLAKGLLAPRTQNESNQVLFSIGATTPYNPQRLIPEAIASDITKPIFIRCSYRLDTEELNILQAELSAISIWLTLGSMGRSFAEMSESITVLSTSQGQQTFNKILSDLQNALRELREHKREVSLTLTIDPIAGLTSGYQIGAAFFSYLDRRLPPNQTIFSYFPADRAIPAQDPPVQIGLADATNQIESHNSQPQLKYQRLKSTIFNAVIKGEQERKDLDRNFKRIFERILKGRQLLAVGVNQHGLLKIEVQDIEGGQSFGIDAMSSGEKGLILTFLLIANTVGRGGIVMLDEPELHLNPAVCKELLSFIVEEYSLTRNIQLLISSHSPEILSGAFEQETCTLYHLISGKMLTPVRRQDYDEVNEALRRLGTSASESLLYKATVFVEGDHDSDVLEVGFDNLFRRYKFKDLGGRKEVEKQIRLLQEAEAKGVTVAPQYFIFDRDEAPSGLTSSSSVRFLQWPRRCLENHLIDIDILTDLLKDPEVASKTVRNFAEVQSLLKSLALSQLNSLVVKQVYNSYSIDNPGLRLSEIQGKSISDAASILSHRLNHIREQLGSLAAGSWEADFVVKSDRLVKEFQQTWEKRWQEDCDGKRLFSDLHRHCQVKMPLLSFKKRVIREMKLAARQNWLEMESLLKNML